MIQRDLAQHKAHLEDESTKPAILLTQRGILACKFDFPDHVP